jgi:hypothetical protein
VSLRYNEHLFGLSLFTLPWAAAGASPVLAYNVVWWTAWMLNGLTTFGLLRRFVPDPYAAFTGSLAFVCSFYVMVHAHGHLHLIWLWPMPLSMLLVERWFDDPRWRRLVPWVLVFLAGALASWYVAVMMLLVNGATVVTLLVWSDRNQGRIRWADATRAAVQAGRRSRDSGVWRRRSVHALCAGVLVAVMLYPFARHYVGMRGAAAETIANSASLASYLVPPQNTISGRWWTENISQQPGAIWGEQSLFAGWSTLALALVGMVGLLRGRDLPRRAWVFPALSVAGFLLSLGPSPSLLGGSNYAPFGWLSDLPGFEGLRAPARFAIVMMLGVSGMAAIGGMVVGRTVTAGRRVLVLAVVPLMLAEWFVIGFRRVSRASTTCRRSIRRQRYVQHGRSCHCPSITGQATGCAARTIFITR